MSRGSVWTRLRKLCSMRLVKGRASGRPNPPASSAGVSPRGSSREGEGVAACLVEDPGLHLLVERARNRHVQQLSGVVGREPLEMKLWQPLEHVLAAELAHREHESHPLRLDPARHERERLRGHVVQPLRVVDDAQERLLLGGVGQEAQDRQAHEEALRWRSGAQAERRAQGVALRARQHRETVEQGRAQRVQPGEGELHLGLDARRPGDPASICGGRQVPQEGGLADARLAAEDQHMTPACADARDKSIEHVALADAVEQCFARHDPSDT